MNKEQVIEKMVEFTGSTKTETIKQLEAFLKTIEFVIENNEDMKLVGYFNLGIVERAQRNGRNPSTKEPMIIPACRAIKIKASPVLKKLIK